MSSKQTVVPYYMVVDAQQLIKFVKEAFGAKIGNITNLPESDKIVHAQMQIGNSKLFFADASANGLCGPECHDKNEEPSTVQFWLNVADADDTYKKAIAAGATGVMEVADQENTRFGGIADPFGNLWWIQSVKY